MKLVCYIVCVSMICIVIALTKKEKEIAKEEAYWDGFRKAVIEYGNLPIRPIILDESTEDIDYKCSHCGKEYIVSKDNKPKYCSECGRYIDW
mgnify:FL=1